MNNFFLRYTLQKLKFRGKNENTNWLLILAMETAEKVKVIEGIPLKFRAILTKTPTSITETFLKLFGTSHFN